MQLREEQRAGLDGLETLTTLLQRARAAHPTAGLYEAADFQWWWRLPRPSDSLPQLFWFDEQGRPAAAAIITAWSEYTSVNPLVLPDADRDVIAHIMSRGLAHAAAAGFDEVSLEVARTDDVLQGILQTHGFVAGGDAVVVVEAWLAADARPEISPLHDDYRLRSRLETTDRPHHMVELVGPDVEARLNQTSLYRPDLDLSAMAAMDEHTASALFWFDPTTETGLVEPMRTEPDHRQRGLARHLLTAGIDRLAGAGARRIKICFEPDNAPARDLYLSVGFEPVRETISYAGATNRAGAPEASLG